uniref:Uncharacterized protein n=1 Tax=Arundo donax TaxID=35708 RepID=A0A0A9B1M0_ARUDO
MGTSIQIHVQENSSCPGSAFRYISEDSQLGLILLFK